MIGQVFKRCFSSTKPNVFVNKHTKVICQGITGKQVEPLQAFFCENLFSFSCFSPFSLFLGLMQIYSEGYLPNRPSFKIRHPDGRWCFP